MRIKTDIRPPPVAIEYAREVRKRLGHHARQIILFGSQAREQAPEGSDYDFIIVVDKRTRALRELICDAGAAMLNKREALCAALMYDHEQWEKVCHSPLGWNVERDGVLL